MGLCVKADEIFCAELNLSFPEKNTTAKYKNKSNILVFTCQLQIFDMKHNWLENKS